MAMRSLMLAGLGPEVKNGAYLARSLFDRTWAKSVEGRIIDRAAGLESLSIDGPAGTMPLLRSRCGAMPDLTSLSLASILTGAGERFEPGDLSDVWDNLAPKTNPSDIDVILLSTTFICEPRSLAKAVRWVARHFPSAKLVLGGQYSNLKYRQVLARHPEVNFVVRGDGEIALPALLRAMRSGSGIGAVPNLVFRAGESGKIHETTRSNVDIETTPSPTPIGYAPVLPYESMRGCPFRCKFCSFPSASPEWRYKSAGKIAGDWRGYAREHGTRLVKAMDSTFTVPSSRLHELLDLLPIPDLKWHAFARANCIRTPSLVRRLADAGCESLSLGFESMSANTLEHMNKKVGADDNRRAFELLRGSGIGFKSSFMAGYPGETIDDYRLTHDFLVNDYEGYFLLSVFSIQDETMPMWEDAGRFRLRVRNADDPDYDWEHDGMSVETARSLVWQTLDMVRKRNDRAVLKLWQADFDTPLHPQADHRTNLRVEKTVERIAMVRRDFPTMRDALAEVARLKASLAADGIRSRPTPVLPKRESP